MDPEQNYTQEQQQDQSYSPPANENENIVRIFL